MTSASSTGVFFEECRYGALRLPPRCRPLVRAEVRPAHPPTTPWLESHSGGPAHPHRGPTGSGKTLAAFLEELDRLFREGLESPLPDETRVVYVSPLKALSADIHLNLAEPRREIRRLAEEMGYEAPRITAAIRSGDTPTSERAAMLRKPPHILVTTPESLYLMLTARAQPGDAAHCPDRHRR